MLSTWIRKALLNRPIRPAPPPPPIKPERRAPGRLLAFAQRWPFVTFFLLVILSNAGPTYMSFAYNEGLILNHYASKAQQDAFWWPVAPAYNILAWTFAVSVMLYLLLPLSRCWIRLRAGQVVPPGELYRCRLRIVNMPAYQVGLNLLGWLPGAVFFPLGICVFGGWDNAGAIWGQFILSFCMSAILATFQTFFLLEAYLTKVLYPDYFQDVRPGDMPGLVRLPLGLRLFLFWVAVGAVPLLTLLVVTLNFTEERTHDQANLHGLAVGVTVFVTASSGLMALMVSRNLISWVTSHSLATEAVTREQFDYRIHAPRPDEFGKLTDRFNDMAAALGRAQEVRETFGQMVGPEVRDEILRSFPGLGGEVRDVTVLFADIRGFTRRSAGQSPEQSVELLNVFLTLAVAAIQEQGGLVNKFLGDGIMALFNAPRQFGDHADRAVASARRLIRGLGDLNRELEHQEIAPLVVGIGIHTGPALVGCIGAHLDDGTGRPKIRREFAAIGETINLGQRVEQMTKVHGGPVLLSEATRVSLTRPLPLVHLGPQAVPGYEGDIVIHRLELP